MASSIKEQLGSSDDLYNKQMEAGGGAPGAPPPPDPGPSIDYFTGGGGAGTPVGVGGIFNLNERDGANGTSTMGGAGGVRPSSPETNHGGAGGDLGQDGQQGVSTGPSHGNTRGGFAGHSGSNGWVGIAVSGNANSFWISTGTITGNVFANVVNMVSHGFDDAFRRGSSSITCDEGNPSIITYVNVAAFAYYKVPLIRGDFILQANVSWAASNRRWYFGVMPVYDGYQFSSTTGISTDDTIYWKLHSNSPGAYIGTLRKYNYTPVSNDVVTITRTGSTITFHVNGVLANTMVNQYTGDYYMFCGHSSGSSERDLRNVKVTIY